MIWTKVRNSKMRSDMIAVNSRSYNTDGDGVLTAHPADVATLVNFCGFEVVGTVNKETVGEQEIRLPATTEEFLDTALALGLTAADLRSMADVLDPPVASVAPVEGSPAEPVTTYVAPPPPGQVEMVTIPPDEPEASETDCSEPISSSPETAEEIKVAPLPPPPDEAGEEVTISMQLSKRELLEIAHQAGVPVKSAWPKAQVFQTIAESRG